MSTCSIVRAFVVMANAGLTVPVLSLRTTSASSPVQPSGRSLYISKHHVSARNAVRDRSTGPPAHGELQPTPLFSRPAALPLDQAKTLIPSSPTLLAAFQASVRRCAMRRLMFESLAVALVLGFVPVTFAQE